MYIGISDLDLWVWRIVRFSCPRQNEFGARGQGRVGLRLEVEEVAALRSCIARSVEEGVEGAV
jgi:hypothetical protein